MGWEAQVEAAAQALRRNRVARLLFRAGRAVYLGVVGLFAVFAISMIALLIGSLAFHVGRDVVEEARSGGGGSGLRAPIEEPELDSTPEKRDGSDSYEFEADDIEQAEEASPEVQEYCDGAVSEAQRLGCLSHVDEVP